MVTPLTDIQVRNAKPKDQPYKIADGGGLHLAVMPIGSKLWRMKFKQANRKESWATYRTF
ncbi:Arm DNA-binding domain-containing protein [Glaciimonas soli]|uniref:Arm DNA-binding domain-containing protein n=1 Tax=Glaciimonas soli TaxID=2590999 RepID=UPI0038993754